jgi:hypothetical protein
MSSRVLIFTLEGMPLQMILAIADHYQARGIAEHFAEEYKRKKMKRIIICEDTNQ